MKTFIWLLGFITISVHLNGQTLSINDLTIKDSGYYHQETIYSGSFSSFYKNGKIKEEGYIKNGKIDSALTTYDKVGFTVSISRFAEGKLIHLTTFYPNTNTVSRKASIKEKKENGICINYYPNGLPQDSGLYAMGKRIGKWTYWNVNGQKNFEITIHDDCWERTDYVYSQDSVYTKTEFFNKYGRKIKK